MKKLYVDFKQYFLECRAEDLGFYMVVGYIIFSYLRPHSLFPVLDLLPWTQLFIIGGLLYAGIKNTLRFQMPHFTIFLYGLVCLLSAYNAVNPTISFKNVDIPFIWLLEALCFTSCINSTKKLKLILILFFLVLFKISFFGARTWVQRGFAFQDFGISGPSGFFQNSGELSLLMAMLTIMSLSVLFGNSSVRKIYYIFPITTVMTVLAASSRASQLALLIGSFIFFLIKGKLNFKYLLIASAVLYGGYMLLPDEQKARFSSAGEDSTSQSRLLYWEKGLEMTAKYPWLGVGFQGFPSYFHDNYADEIPEDASFGKRREVAHNTLIEVSSETGYLGLGAYLLMYFIVFKINRDSRRILRGTDLNKQQPWLYQFTIGLDIAQILFIVGAFFMSVALYPYNYFMIMFALSLRNSVFTEITAQKKCAEANAVLGLNA
jgi:O-antigen ligase